MESLSLVRTKSRSSKVEFGFQNSERKTKRLIEMFNVGKSFENIQVVDKLNQVANLRMRDAQVRFLEDQFQVADGNPFAQ